MTDLSMTPIPMRGTTRGRRRQGIMTPVTESEDGWNSRSIIGKACGGAALTVALAWSSWWLADSPGSDFPAWLSAWATVFGVAAAIVAGFYAARAFRLEFQRERRWEEGQRTAQASLVGAWPGALNLGSYERTGGIYEPDTTTIVGVSVYARNASPLPVSEVRITFVLALLDTNGRVQGSSSIGSEFLASLAPDSEPKPIWLESVSPDDPYLVPDEDEVARTSLRVELTFRDAADQLWHRDMVGRLSAIE